MRGPFHRGSARYLGLIAAAGLLATTAMSTGPATAAPLTSASTAKSQAATAAYSAGRYIVTFVDDPAASYDGSRKGFAATRPAAGKKLNTNSAAVKAWRGHLTAGHDAALAKVGATKLYDYTVTNNAVAVQLSAKQATGLAKTAGVVRLEKDQLRTPDTTDSPAFLGLSAGGGLWSQLGGNKNAGAGTVVGIVDSGIWPESAAFAGGTGIPIPATWKGDKTSCQSGVNFGTSTCNDKLIGARYYVAGFGKHNIAKEEFLSPRDGSGHGSHTASTAAGNNGTNVTIDGKAIGTGSGMAPGAKIAMYKVCWEAKPGFNPGCFSSDSVAAINQAVADGVDVINYSIGGSSESSVLDSVEQAFRAASNANVFVANSAGNSGPGASTLDHPSPWLTTVAAGTFRRAFQAVELGNGARYVGASTTPSLTIAAPLVTAVAVKAASATDTNAALCAAGTLDPAKAAGKVVLCNRGVVDRIEKGFEVKRVGGVGMVMANTSANSLNGDYHPVPAVHINHIDGALVRTYATTAVAPTAKIVPLTAEELAAAPQVPEVTDFSSRGPSTTTGGDILKPDITAPGNDVVAAVAPPSNHGRSWDFYSGTSMSSPHIAGIGALMKAAHPTWLPSEIKSALMTSASDTVSSANDPFAQGAGWVKPNSAVNPGLVYPTSAMEYRRYMVGLGVQFAPPNDTLTALSGSELNQASIAVGKLAGVTTLTRTVKNVSGGAATFTAATLLPGFDVTVTPSTLTLADGASGSFTVRLSRTTAPLGAWAVGKLTWSGGAYQVRSPIAVRPVALSAPTEVHADASASGSKTYQVTPGFTGNLTNSVAGLVGVTPEAGSVATGSFDSAAPVDDAATNKYTVVVPAGTKVARFSLDSDDNTADLDLFVYRGTTLVALSASGAADEQVTMLNPTAGTYNVYVNGFATPGGITGYHQSNFVVGPATVGNASVTPNPASVTSGTPTTLTATWSGLIPAQRWLGLISYGEAGDVTLLSVG
jgi:hypothetical protein